MAAVQSPISLENERRKVMMSILSIEKEIASFKARSCRLPDPSNADQWVDFINVVHQKLKAKQRANTPKEFKEMLEQYAEKFEEAKFKPEYKALNEIVDICTAFKTIAIDGRTRIIDALEGHIVKYCLSFTTETFQADLPCVFEYENKCTKWRQDILEAGKVIQANCKRIKSMSTNFEEYVQNFQHILHFMIMCMDDFPDMYEPLKRWVNTDEAYARKLYEAVVDLEARQRVVNAELHHHLIHVSMTKEKIRSRTYKNKLLHKVWKDTLDTKRVSRNKEKKLWELIELHEKKLAQTRPKLDNALAKLHSGATDSPLEFNKDAEVATKFQDEINSIDAQLQCLNQTLTVARKDKVVIQKEVHKRKAIFDKSLMIFGHDEESAAGESTAIEALKEEDSVLSHKIERLKYIRHLKLKHDTVKKVHDSGNVDGLRIENEGGVSPRLAQRKVATRGASPRGSWTDRTQRASRKALDRTIRSLESLNASEQSGTLIVVN